MLAVAVRGVIGDVSGGSVFYALAARRKGEPSDVMDSPQDPNIKRGYRRKRLIILLHDILILTNQTNQRWHSPLLTSARYVSHPLERA